MTTRTRFAPSPTGDLHIGGARTALFCWAFARHHDGEFLLRIEDTDAARSTQKSIDSIIAALGWLDLSPDAPPVYQSQRREKYRKLADDIVKRGEAYYCYATLAELDALRQSQIAAGQTPRYDRRWRDSKKTPPRGIEPAIRLKTPLAGAISFVDLVKGETAVDNVELDDPVVLRADGTPTYNFACAADDAQMKITHVARGDDHVRNTLRQLHIFAALGEAPPRYAHLPLIFNAAKDDDGNLRRDARGEIVYERMSKRKRIDAADVMSYRAAGYLPEALVNYLARLGFSFPDSREIFSQTELAAAFDFRRVQKSPARFDLGKLRWINHEYLQKTPNAKLRDLCPTAAADSILDLVKPRAATLAELRDELSIFTAAPAPESARALFAAQIDEDNRAAFFELRRRLAATPDSEWRAENIKSLLSQTAKERQLKFPRLAMPLRAALCGREQSPDIAAVAALLGKPAAAARLRACDDGQALAAGL